MKKRTITAAVLVALLGPAAYFGGIYFLICGLVLVLHAGYEMMNMYATKHPSLKVLKWIVPIMCCILLALIYLSSTKGLDASVFGIILTKDGVIASDTSISQTEIRQKLLYYFWILAAYIAFIIICFCVTLFTKDSSAEDMMGCSTTLAYCGLLMGFGICVEYIQPITNVSWLPSTQFGGRSFVYLCSIVMSCDAFAYFVGSKYGKTKIFPHISPKKSLEGCIAGVLASSVIGTAIAVLPTKYVLFDIFSNGNFWTRFGSLLAVFLFSMVLSIVGIMGDLVASKFKRTYEIKDYGTIFPGHGGVLDRFDSLILTAATYYCVIQMIQLLLVGVAE